MTVELPDLRSRIRLDTSELDAGLKSATSALQNAGSHVGSIGGRIAAGVGEFVKWGAAGVAAAGLVATAIGVKAVGAASDLNETLSKVGVVFGPAAKDVTQFAQKMSDDFGLPKREILDAASAIGLVGKASGLSQKDAAKMSKEMAGLAADAASFYNVPLDEALDTIKSALVGEAEPIRKFGVLLNEAAVKEEAVRLGVAGAGEELTEQQKVLARSSLITKGMTDASGDLARTQGSVANQVRALKGHFQNFLTTVGGAVLPVVEKLIGGFGNFARDIVRIVSPAVERLGRIFENIDLGGKILAKLAPIGDRIEGLVGGWADIFTEFANNIEEAINKGDWAGVRGMVREMLGLAIGDIAPELGRLIETGDWDGVKDKAGAKFKTLLAEATEALTGSAETITRIGVALGIVMAKAFASPGFTGAVGSGIRAGVTGADVNKAIDGAGQSIADRLTGGIVVGLTVGTKTGSPQAGVAAGLISAIGLDNILTAIDDFLRTKLPLVVGLVAAVVAAIVLPIAAIPAAIIGAIAGIVTLIVQNWDTISRVTSETWHAFDTAIRNAIDNAVGWLWGLPGRAIGAIVAFKDAVDLWASRTWESFTGWVGRTIGDVVEWFNGLPGRIAESLRSWRSGVDTGAEEAGESLTTRIGTAIDSVVAFFWGLPGRAVGAIVDLANRIANAIPTPGEILSGIGRAIVQGLIDGITSAIPDVTTVLGRLTSAIPTWKGPPARDAKLLYGAGQTIMSGLIGGIQSSLPDLRSTLATVTNAIDVSGSLAASVPRAGYLTPASATATSAGPSLSAQVYVTIQGNADRQQVREGVTDGLSALLRELKAV